MVTDAQTPTPAAAPAAPAAPSLADLKAQMAKAIELEDYSQVAQIARALKAAQTAEREAKDAETSTQRTELTQKIMDKVGAIISKFQDQVTALVGADRAEILYAWSPEKGVVCHIMKVQAKVVSGEPRKARTPGSGTPAPKGGPSSEEMLATYGAEIMRPDAKEGEKFAGVTFQQQWDSSSDKNNRYQVRVALLKRHTAV